MTTLQRTYRYFVIGHANISVKSKNLELLDLVGHWMQEFEVQHSITSAPHIQLTLIAYESNERIPYILPKEAVLLHKNECTEYYEYRRLWIVVLQSATMIINRSNNKILAFVHYKDLKTPQYLEDFMHPVMELLRQNGVYAHHAAAVSLNGRGLLIVGKSGQGKTTLSVDLLSNGFDFLADDRCFLREGEQGVEVIGFYEPIRYFSDNVKHIHSIEEATRNQNLPRLSNDKSQLDLSLIYRNRIIDKSTLAGLVFPQYSPQETTSRVEKIPSGESLITLLPLTMVCFDRETSKTHFKFTAKLVATVPSIKLIMGQDHERWHILIKEYLDSIPDDETKVSIDLSGHHCNLP